MPSRALLTEVQTISNAEITQALANQGIARVSLSAPVTRTSTATLSNTGLTALTVSLLPSSRYRLTYRLFASHPVGGGGMKLGFTFPSVLTQFDGNLNFTNNSGNVGFYIYPAWDINGFGSGDAVMDDSDTDQKGGLIFIADITTGSTANTYGDFAVVFAQSTSNANASTMSQNSCVEVLKF